MKEKVVQIKLPKPHDGQQKVINSKARFKVLMCGRRWGKSLVSMVIALKDMLAGKHVAYVTPEFNLGKEFFKEFLLLLSPDVIRKNNRTDLYIELITGGSVRFFSGNAIDSFRGRKFHKVIIDEAAFIPDLQSAWNQSIRPTLTDYKGDAIFISTPKGKNFFDALFNRGKNEETDYESFHFTSYDNPHIPAMEIDAAKEELPEAAFNQEYMAVPSEDANNPFGAAYIKQNIIETLSSKHTVVFGIDVAKVRDWTVIVGLDEDGRLSYFDRFRQPWEVTKDKIRSLPSSTMKVMDSTGVGDVILEGLSFDVKNLKGFKFTGESKPKIIMGLIKAVEMGKVKYNQIIADEMMVFEYKTTATGHIQYNAASGYNDDTICALAMAYANMKYFTHLTNWRLYPV